MMLWFVYPAAGMVFGEMLKKTADKNLFYKKTLAVSVTVLASIGLSVIWKRVCPGAVRQKDRHLSS